MRGSEWLILITLLGEGASLDAAGTYTWTSNVNGNWSSSANWLGGSPPPTNGSVDTILEFTNSSAGISVTATNDLVVGPATAYQVNQLLLDTRYGSVTNVNLAQTGLTIAGSPIEFVVNGAAAPRLDMFGAATSISANLVLTNDTTIGGTGQGVLTLSGTISGPGTLTIDRSGRGETYLKGTNSHAATILKNGVLTLNTGAGLGSGPLTINGGILRLVPSTTASPPPITIINAITANNTLVLQGNNVDTVTATFSGIIGGPSGVRVEYSTNIYKLAAANTFQGPLAIGPATNVSGGPEVRLVDAGSALSASSVSVGANSTLKLDDSGTSNLTNRIGPAIPVSLNGGTLSVVGTGAATVTTTENIDSLIANGFATITLTITSSRPLELNLTSASPLVRNNQAVFFFNGSTFGQLNALAGAAANLVLANPANVTANLIGGGGSPASGSAKNISILPYAVATPSLASDPDTFVTYSAAKGVQPLTSTQYQSSISAAGPQDNVRITTTANGTVPAGGATVNSLVVFNSSSSTTVNVAGGPLTLNSGAVLVDTANDLSIDALVFPSGVEGVLTTSLTVSNKTVTVGTITGSSAGLTKSGNAPLIVTNPLAVPGALTVNSGSVDIANDSTLGTVTGVLLNGGSLRFGGPTSSARPFAVGPAGGIFDVLNAGDTVNIAQPIGGTNGWLVKQGLGTLVLGGTNTFSAGVVVTKGVLSVSDDSNLGSPAGPILLGSATLRFTGSALITSSRTITLTGLTVNTFLDVQSDVTLNGPIHVAIRSFSSLGFTKTGGGTLRLASPDNSFNDTLTVSAGTLQVDGVVPAMNANNTGIQIQPGTFLRGAGTIRRDVTINLGTLAPGSSTATGILTIRGQTAFISSPSSVFAVRLAGDLPGVGYDQLVVDNAQALIGGATLSYDFSPGVSGTTPLTILQTVNAGSLPSGTFAGMPNGTTLGTFNGTTWKIIYTYGTNGHIDLVATPEPSGILGLSVLFMAMAYRRRSNATGNN